MVNRYYTIGEINELANNALSSNPILSNITAKGEISNYTDHFSGHQYFTLKDKDALIKCVMFKGNAQALAFKPKVGDKVVVTGSVGIFKRDGQYQMYVKTMGLDGVGDLYAKFAMLKEKLAKEGLFDNAHKKSLPFLPKKIGVVTSSQGAAVQDIINIITRRFDNSYIVIYPTKVQGKDAYLSIIDGIAYFNNDDEVDVIIVGRGGGSMEDLWAFNEEPLARAIYNSEKPIISAVGHETDFFISDFVADLRAPTPSAAAELCVRDKVHLKHDLEMKKNGMTVKVKSVIDKNRGQVLALKNRIIAFNPINKNNQQRQVLDGLSNQMNKAAAEIIAKGKRLLTDNSEALNAVINEEITKRKTRLGLLTARLEALNPKDILNRGYSIVEDGEGTLVDSAKKLKTNDKITLVFHDGSKKARVE